MLLKRKTLIAAALLGMGSNVAMAQEETSSPADFTSMFTDGKASFDFRYRYEYVDDDAFSRNAKASTLRSRLTFASATWQGVSFLAEFDDVTAIGDDDYNSTANGNTQYPVVADPEGTEVNQAWLKYSFDKASGS